ncbi:hypothetical protein BaRGS_00004077 [Batillaria attramentaria]|uniref:Uncharacterized protein n=1 Tax=Batillaria attramentaria TaxID=370345 RepID=A0ABD0LZA9_9CAEN
MFPCKQNRPSFTLKHDLTAKGAKICGTIFFVQIFISVSDGIGRKGRTQAGGKKTNRFNSQLREKSKHDLTMMLIGLQNTATITEPRQAAVCCHDRSPP